MKKIIITMLLCFPGICFSQEINQPRIEVFGTAKNEVVPDIMHWNLSVNNKGKELEEVSQTHAATVSEVIRLLKGNGVDKKKIQTSRMSFGENLVYRNNSRVREGYVADTSITFELSDFNKYQDLWFALSSINEVSVLRVSYDYSKRINVQNETRKLALIAAKEKAETMANTLGVEVANVLSITEIPNTYIGVNSNVLRSELVSANNSTDQSYSLGSITIEVKVKLVMGLISN